MKQKFTILLITLILAMSTGCSSLAKSDYEGPGAVIKAELAKNPIKEGEINGIYDDLEGKTFKVQTTQKLDKSDPYGDVDSAKEETKSGYNWLCVPYSDITTDVMLWLTDDEWNKLNYSKGDTIVLQIDDVMFRGTKDGSIRQYYINAHLAE